MQLWGISKAIPCFCSDAVYVAVALLALLPRRDAPTCMLDSAATVSRTSLQLLEKTEVETSPS